jgi:tetratricopeptide (TPR) repeat protein
MRLAWIVLGWVVFGCVITALLFPMFAKAKNGNGRYSMRAQLRAKERSKLFADYQAAIREERYADAEAPLKQLLRMKPMFAHVYLDLARVYEKQGKDREAWKAYGDVFDPRTRAAADISHDPLLLIHYAKLSEKLVEATKATWAYKQALEYGQSSLADGSPLINKEVTDPKLIKAHALVRASLDHTVSASRGLRLAKEAVGVAPRSPIVRYYYAHHLEMSRKYKSARTEFEKAASLASGLAWVGKAKKRADGLSLRVPSATSSPRPQPDHPHRR